MEILAEIAIAISQFIGELLLQIIFEAIAELGTRKTRPSGKLQPPHPMLAALGYVILGAVAGGISLLIWPGSFIDSGWLRMVNLFVAPIIAGAMMAMLGGWRRRKGQDLIRLDTFIFGFLFALAMAGVRYAWAR